MCEACAWQVEAADAAMMPAARSMKVKRRKLTNIWNLTSLDILARLRALRDCWSDPYTIIVSDDPSSENDSLYLRCGDRYPVRLAELRDAGGHSLRSINNDAVRRQTLAAAEVFNDLDSLHNVFNSRLLHAT